jgi:hypothetical protein
MYRKRQSSEKLKNDAECMPVAFRELLRCRLFGHIQEAGFQSVTVHKQKEVQLPQEILQKYLNEEEIRQFNQKEIGIFSITVAGEKAIEGSIN